MPAVTIADLVRATLRHRPDRILVGEVRGPEAFDLLQALNTGHLGSLTTIHANNAEQALTRLAHCVLTANVGLAPPQHARGDHPGDPSGGPPGTTGRAADGDRGRARTGLRSAQDRFVVEPWSPELRFRKEQRMTRLLKQRDRVLVTVGRCPAADAESTPTAPSGADVVPRRDLARHCHDSGQPGDPNPPPPTSGDMTWTFEVVPQTNMQSLRATIRSSHPWLTMDTTGSTALSPGNSPPTQISTHGEFNSPRGCRGTFGSVGMRRRRASRPTSPERTASRPRSRAASC